VIKKPISKFTKIFNKNLFQKSKGIVLGILIALLFLPIFSVAKPVLAATCDIKIGTATTVEPNFLVSRTKVKWDENFDVYMDVRFKKDAAGEQAAKDCQSMAKTGYKFELYMYNGTGPLSSTIGKKVTGLDAQFYTPTEANGNSYGYVVKFSTSAKELGEAEPGSTKYNVKGEPVNVNPNPMPARYLFGYFTKKDNASAASGSTEKFKDTPTITAHKDAVDEQPKPLPDVPTAPPTTPGKDGSQGVSFDEISLAVSIGGADTDKFKNFYRVSPSDGYIAIPTKPEAGRTGRENKLVTFSEFDKTGIPVKIGLGTASTVDNIVWNGADKSTWITYSKLSAQYPTIASALSGGHYMKELFGLSLEDSVFKDKSVCGVSAFSGTQYFCSGPKVKRLAQSSNANSVGKGDFLDFPFYVGKSKTLTEMGISGTSVKVYQAHILPSYSVAASWKDWALKFVFTPLLLTPGNVSSTFSPEGFSNAKEPVMKLYFEVYPNKAELEKHMNDPIPDAVPEYKAVETGNTESGGTDSAVGALFGFLKKVIAFIVLLLTSFIYWIFATILVPILVALIQVHPYKDEFVNFIYPGWIIIRNISNIAFIVALLYMGLKILFQQEDASKSRGFIVTLILMALLVNFSLVIGQGIVAIADTFQAQFLPEDSKVIETLGHKLMVDPILIFRGNGGVATGGTFTAEAAASDLPKAIVLLVLAIAAFFSFVALIAFMFVRLVALWVLYMMSPLAYVGRILPETKKYASQWWQEFIKYAFSVPIMAFFLNIAALIAVTFSAQSGDQVQVSGARGYLLGSSAAGVTEFALTTVSHFIVLIFLFMGMKYALQFGGAGAKQIVGAAKGGFDFLTQKIPKEFAKSQYARKIEGGMLDPKAWAKSYKDRVVTTDKNKRAERLSRKANRLSPGNILPPEGSLITRAGHIAKYLGAKAIGKDPHRELARASSLRDKATILTAPERTELETAQADNNVKKTKVENEQTLLEHNTLTNTRAKQYKDQIDDRLDQIYARRIDLLSRQTKLDSQGKKDGEEYKNNERELKGMVTDEAALREAKTALLDARSRSPVRGEVNLNPSDLSKLSIVFSPDDLKVELSEELKKVESKAKTYNRQLSEDDARKGRYGVSAMTPTERENLEKEAMKLSIEAAKRYMPASAAAIEARRTLQADQAKKVEHMDDVDELVEAFEGAMKKNNMPFATEIAKKLAKIGGMDELLKKNGYNNNLKEFQQFIDKKFAKMAPQVRLQIGSEISTIAKSNGNLTLGNSNQYKYNPSSGESVINWAQPEQSKRKLNAKLKGMGGDALAKLEKTDFTEERGGVHYLHQGFIDAINGLGVNGMNAFVRNLPKGKKDHILKAKNLTEIRDQVRARLV
jgi:hypothetical protein